MAVIITIIIMVVTTMTTEIKIDLNLDQITDKMSKSYNASKISIQRSILVSMQRNRDKLFAAEGAYNGHNKWAPLKCRKGQILHKSGTLRKSIAPINKTGAPGESGISFISGDEYVIGTRLKYAATQSFGAEFITTMKQRAYLSYNKICGMRWPIKIRIPSRQFHELNDKDTQDIATSLERRIQAVLERGSSNATN